MLFCILCLFCVCLLAVENEDCSPLLAEYFRMKKILDDEDTAEEKPSQLVFEITSDDGFYIRARTCDGKMTWTVVSVCLLYMSLASHVRYKKCRGWYQVCANKMVLSFSV